MTCDFISSDFGDITLTVKPSTTVHEKTQVTIKCTVDALPAAEIQLSRNDGIFLSSSNETLNRELGGTKEVESNRVSYTVGASKDWMGTIKCYGENIAGSGENSTDFIVQSMCVVLLFGSSKVTLIVLQLVHPLQHSV